MTAEVGNLAAKVAHLFWFRSQIYPHTGYDDLEWDALPLCSICSYDNITDFLGALWAACVCIRILNVENMCYLIMYNTVFIWKMEKNV